MGCLSCWAKSKSRKWRSSPRVPTMKMPRSYTTGRRDSCPRKKSSVDANRFLSSSRVLGTGVGTVCDSDVRCIDRDRWMILGKSVDELRDIRVQKCGGEFSRLLAVSRAVRPAQP